MSGTKVDVCLGPRPYICASEVHCQIALECQKLLWYEYDISHLDAVTFLPGSAQTRQTSFHVGFKLLKKMSCLFFKQTIGCWLPEKMNSVLGFTAHLTQHFTVGQWFGVQPWLNMLKILWGWWHKYLCLENLWQSDWDHVNINQIVS